MVDLSLALEWLDVNCATGVVTWKRDAPNRKTKAGAIAGTALRYRTIILRGPIWGGRFRVAVHRLVWAKANGRWPLCEIDHINGDGLDNRLCNLRECSHEENGRNCRSRTNNTSGFKGVSFHKPSGKWAAQIHPRGKHITIGLFDQPERAADAYWLKAQELFGEFARRA